MPKEIEIYKPYWDYSSERGRNEWEWEKANSQFPRHSLLASMNMEKYEINELKGRSFPSWER